MDKRYQVFVSSTYSDLVAERAEVMQALLELNCMPAGMELFPAANDDQWTWITKVIDESDYYIVIVGGRYGSVSSLTGQSYTEMEYRYAVEVGKPVIAFLHEDPAKIESGKTEQASDTRAKLHAFRELVQKRLCKFWSSPADLGAKVSRSLTQLIKQHPASGWIRSTELTAATAPEEVLRLRRRIEDLEGKLATARTEPPPQSHNLARGNQEVALQYTYRRRSKQPNESGKLTWQSAGAGQGTLVTTWDDIFSYVAPRMIGGVSEYHFPQIIRDVADRQVRQKLEKRSRGERIDDIRLTDESYNRVLVQLRALGLITLFTDDRNAEWQLTPYGDNYMTTVIAAKAVV